MDKIEKAFKKLNAKERAQIKQILVELNSGRFKNLDIKKLKGRDDIFRVKKGNFRIIYRLLNKRIYILSIDRRRENTYKF